MSRTVVTLSALIGCVATFFLVSRASPDDPPTPTDYRDIAAHLVDRGNATTEGIVQYRHYLFTVESAAFDSLCALLAATHETPDESLIADVEAWLSANQPMAREAWSGVCAFSANEWRSDIARIDGVDTLQATIDAAAAATHAQAERVTRRVVLHSDGTTKTTIEDGLIVHLQNVAGALHPLMPIDISLGPWQDAIDLGANVQGQEIIAMSNPDRSTITYRNTDTGGAWSATDYDFSPTLDWAPLRVRTYDAEGMMEQRVHGFASSSSPEPIVRPAVIAHGTLQPGDQVRASVWGVDSWQESSTPQDTALLKPPLHLEVDFTGGSGPVTTVREPPYFNGVAPCDRLMVAVDNVISSWGTGNLDADFVRDGIVDSLDLDFVLGQFGGSGQ